MKDFAVFWGCTIQARFPFLEVSTRLVFERFGLPYRDIDGFTCCPEKSLVNNIDHGLWELTAARNIAMVEEMGLNLVSPCTGCVSNLATVNKELCHDEAKKGAVNSMLKEVGLEVGGHAALHHLVPFFHDEVGINAVRSRVVIPMKGMRVAIHYGCHMIRPSHSLNNDDPLEPVKFDRLVEALGCESVKHRTKMMCCGQGLDRVDQHENALHMARIKLRELSSLDIDAMVLCCPSCYLQFDNNQFLMEKDGEKFGIPILYFTELLGLAVGYGAEELGLMNHRVGVAPFLEKWERIGGEGSEVGGLESELEDIGVFGL